MDGVKGDRLSRKEGVVGGGGTYKRFRARARGSASPLNKRRSHIRIILSDDIGSDGRKKSTEDVDDVASADAPKVRQQKTSAVRGKSKGTPRAQVKNKDTEGAEKKAEKKPTKDKD